MRTGPLIACVLACALVVGGCASGTGDEGEFVVGAGAYTSAFDAARDALREAGYTLDRVDARAGVITTMPRNEPALDAGAGGAASAWNAQRSVARVTFAPAGGASVADLRGHEGAVDAHVEVVVERLQRPGRQVASMSIRRSSTWREPGWEERGMQPSHSVVFGLDEGAAARLAGRIRSKGERLSGLSVVNPAE